MLDPAMSFGSLDSQSIEISEYISNKEGGTYGAVDDTSTIREPQTSASPGADVIILDSTLEHIQALQKSISPGYEIISINSIEDGIQQISSAIADFQAIDSLHVIAHGGPGYLKLGNSYLSYASLPDYKDDLLGWAKSFTEEADVLLYGCNVAANAIGQDFVRQLSDWTGADFAASADWTGSSELGGDWNFEFSTGNIESCSPFDDATLATQQDILLAYERVNEGLLALYTFDAGTGEIVYDSSGIGPALNLSITNPENVFWGDGTLTVDGNTLISSTVPATKLYSSISNSNALTIEAWIAPQNTNQSGPARIATLSSNTVNRNFTLGQDKNQFNVRLRTTTTGKNGLNPSLYSPAESLNTDLTHVVYSWDINSGAKIFVDNQLVASDAILGDSSSWNENYKFALANEFTGDRPWQGTFDLVAIYGQAFDANEVTQNFLAGPQGLHTANNAPEAISDEFSISEDAVGIALDVLDNDFDVDGDSLIITEISPVNQGGTATINETKDMLFYTPMADFVGTETFTYTISDGHGGTSEESITLLVANTNDAPTALPDNFYVNSNSSENLLSVLDNDTDIDDKDRIFITSVGAPDNGGVITISDTQDSLLYTPASGFVGTETFLYTIQDEIGEVSTSTVAVEVSESIVFPEDAGILNVLSFGAIPDDGIDDTTAIQAALDFQANGNRIVYLPAGTYLISDRLDWPQGNRGGLEQKRTILQGEGRDLTTIRLMDNIPGYQDPEAPKALIWTGTGPAQRFRNAIRDLTINAGTGNPGAIGVQFIANNQGGIRNVAITSEDGQGRVGLDMKYTDEIGPLYVKGLHIEGFDYGIQTYWQTASITFEDVSLENQNVLGWENSGQAVFIRGLHSRNAVTVLKNVKDRPSSVTLIDANLVGIGDASNRPAILNQKSMFLRNIQTTGYQMLVKHDDKGRGNEPGIFAPDIDEWLSHGEAPLSLFDSPNVSLDLLIEDIPELAWDPLSQWVSPLEFGGFPNDNEDDTAAIQAAIDSGATTVYLPNGRWLIEEELILRQNVKRLLGTEARLQSNSKTKLVFEEGEQPVVWLERLDMRGDIDIVHASSRTLVLSSLVMSGRYSNTGTGDLFIEDVVGGPFYFKDQNVWARQLNPETDTQVTADAAKIVNDGGHLWILGLKTERPGTIIQTMNGGQTEAIGGFIYSTGGEKIDPAFINKDSSLSLAGVGERNFNGNPFVIWVEETRNGETQILPASKPLGILYVGYESKSD
jgi:hypothetical protein